MALELFGSHQHGSRSRARAAHSISDMTDELFEPEDSHRIHGYHYLVLAAPVAQPQWMIRMERGSWKGALLVAIFSLFFSDTPIRVRVVRFRRRVSLRWETICASDYAHPEAANRAAREWDRQLANGTVPAGALAATRQPTWRSAAVRGTASLLVASAVANVAAKLSVRRRRPPLDGLLLARRVRRRPLTTSFPSGHTASAAAFAVAAAREAPEVALPLGLPAGGVGLSRVWTGAHYPGDVLVGAGLGAAVAVALPRSVPFRSQPES